jgi:hypothetical protein
MTVEYYLGGHNMSQDYYVNVKTDTKWKAYNHVANEWYPLPGYDEGATDVQMKSNFAKAKEDNHAVVKVHYVKDTDFKVGHEWVNITEGIKDLSDDYLNEDKDKLIFVPKSNNRSKRSFTPDTIADKAESIEAPF